MNTTQTPPPPGTPPPTPDAPPRLLRRRTGHLGGVAAGLGHYLDVDPNVVRVGFVLASFVGGTGVLLYLAGWLLLPTEDEDRSDRPIALRTDSTTVVVAAAILSVAAWVVLGPWERNGGLLLPLLLVGVGVWLLNQRSDATDRPAGAAPTGATGPAWPADGATGTGTGTSDRSNEPASPSASWSTEPWSSSRGRSSGPASPSTDLVPAPPTPGPDVTPAPTVEGPGHFHWEPPTEEDPPGDAGPPPPPGGASYEWAIPHGPSEEPARTRTAGPPVLSVTLAVLALAVGTLLVLHTVDVIEASAVLLAGTAFVVVTAGLVVGVILRRARGLVAVALLAAVGLAASPFVDTAIDDGVGDRVIRVGGAADLDAEYRLGLGSLVLDLRDIDPADLGRDLAVSVGTGRAEVIVPADARVQVEGSATGGSVALLGRERDGTRVSFSVTDGPERPETLRLDAEVGLGRLEVRRAG